MENEKKDSGKGAKFDEAEFQAAQERYNKSIRRLKSRPDMAARIDSPYRGGQDIYLSTVTNDLLSWEWKPWDEQAWGFEVNKVIMPSQALTIIERQEAEGIIGTDLKMLFYARQDAEAEAMESKAWQKAYDAIREKEQEAQTLLSSGEVVMEGDFGRLIRRNGGATAFFNRLAQLNEILIEETPYLDKIDAIEHRAYRKHMKAHASEYDDAEQLLVSLVTQAALYGTRVKSFRDKCKAELLRYGKNVPPRDWTAGIDDTTDRIIKSLPEVAWHDFLYSPQIEFAGIKPYADRLKELDADTDKRFEAWAKEIVRRATEDTEEEKTAIKSLLDGQGIVIITPAQERAERRRQKRDKAKSLEIVEETAPPLFDYISNGQLIRHSLHTALLGDRLGRYASQLKNKGTKVSIEQPSNDEREISFLSEGSLTVLNIGAFSKFISSGGLAGKIIALLFVQANKRYSTKTGKLSSYDVDISLDDFKAMMPWRKGRASIYRDIKTAVEGLETWIVEARSFRKEKKTGERKAVKETGKTRIGPIRAVSAFERGRMTFTLEEALNWAFVQEYMGLIPHFVFALKPHGFNLLYELAGHATRNRDEKPITTKGNVSLTLRHAQQWLGLPDETQTTNPRRDIKDPLINAIMDIADANHRLDEPCANVYMDLSRTKTGDSDTATIKDWLNNGRVVFTPQGKYREAFIRMETAIGQKREKGIAREDKTSEAALTKHKLNKLAEQEREQKAEEAQQRIEAERRQWAEQQKDKPAYVKL